MATSSYLNRKTPGVYITEIDAFGTSIVGVATAVPIFIGYTEFAGDPTTGQSLYNVPVAISSMTEFTNYFGGPAPQSYSVTVITPPPSPSPAPSPAPSASGSVAVAPTPSFTADYTMATNTSSESSGAGMKVAPTGFMLASNALPNEPNQFNLYWQMRLFFANGGGNCYVVSVGSYWVGELPTSAPTPDGWTVGSIAAGSTATAGDPGLLVGLQAAGFAVGPTMTVIPEACQLPQNATRTDYGDVVTAMLEQASLLQDRVAILDLPGCMAADTFDEIQASQSAFSDAIAPAAANVSYGVAYAPAVISSVVTPNDILYTNLIAEDDAGNEVVNNILTTQANELYSGTQLGQIQAAIAAAFPLGTGITKANTQQYSNDATAYTAFTDPATATLSQRTALDNLLLNALPVFAKIEQQIANSMNVAPPSGLIAGIWTKSDAQSGVWNAPANIALASVISPLYNMNDTQQAAFNVPTNGQAIDILRAQPGRGTVVWGARTLDGNSQDYRYVQVRRTLIYIEQSIKTALQSYVFAPNDATTWSTVTASVSNFLTGLWQQGGLMGTKPSEAFTVSCGLGSTMTSQDILNGYMVVAVTLQMIHPAEFIELTFTQSMGS
jgi:hypothetical protein